MLSSFDFLVKTLIKKKKGVKQYSIKSIFSSKFFYKQMILILTVMKNNNCKLSPVF
jgi:hypothetical protein